MHLLGVDDSQVVLLQEKPVEHLMYTFFLTVYIIMFAICQQLSVAVLVSLINRS